MGRFKKAIATMLVACMTMVAPASLGMAKVSANETNKGKMSVYSIDAGRKYFSVDQLKEIIYTANKTGFTHVQLLFGNDGLRLLLDDMTIVVNGQTYASDDVKEAITEGTKAYYDDPNGTVLNQKEIEEILAYAKSKNIKIIPVVSSPGHMDAILNTMETLGIKNPKYDYQGSVSKTTMDLNNKDAVEFTKALVEKYAKYFSGKVEYFNFGADEYANDATYHGPSKKSGFLVLQEEGLYDDFIDYINDLSDIVKENKMKPICFNDGIYYNKDESNGVVDKDITVAYWTPGFDRYSPAPAKFLVEKGFKILNTNDNWYYVVGRNGEGWWYGSAMATDSMKKFKFDRVVGTEENDKLPIVGSMACTWCDEPKSTYKPSVVKGLMELFSEQNPEYLTPSKKSDKVEIAQRISGNNRYETALEVSKKSFSSAEKVYLVSGEKFPDALSASSLTANGKAPILLINDKNVDKVLAEIDRLKVKEIVFVGGGSVSKVGESKVEEFAKEESIKVEKLEGKDRYETSVKVAEQAIANFGNKGKVIIADGRNYPDAVSIAPYASREGMPIILVNGNKVSKDVETFLTKNNIKEAVIVGGDKAVGKDVEKLFEKFDRVAGDNRYETSKKIAEKFFVSSGSICIASGEDFADSLSASYYAAKKNAPVIITKSKSLHNSTKKFLEENYGKQCYVIGGEKAVDSNIFK